MNASRSKTISGHPEFTTINERMVYTYGIIYVCPEEFVEHCRTMGIDESTLKYYASSNMSMGDRRKRGDLVESAIQDMMSTPYVRLAKRRLSCNYLFKMIADQNPMVRISLDREFIRNKLLVNKFKLTHPDVYDMIVKAYNETLYLG